jgi:adenylate kinase family enzyme
VKAEITIALLKKAMKKHGWEKTIFLIDGFPRDIDNYKK